MAQGDAMTYWLNRLVISVAAVIVILLSIGAYYYYWIEAQRQEALKRYHRAMNTFKKQAEEANASVLRVFDTTARAGTLSEMLAIGNSSYTRSLSAIERSISTIPVSDNCTSRFQEKGGNPVLTLEFSGTAQNADRHPETLNLRLTSDFKVLISPYVRDAMTRTFDAFLLADDQKRREVFLEEGNVGASGKDLEPLDDASKARLEEPELPLAGKRYLAFSREITLFSASSGTCTGGERRTVMAVGLVQRETLWAASRRIPQVPLIVLGSIVLALLFCYPFLKLSTLRRSDRFNIWDVCALATCAAALSALTIFLVFMLFSQRSLAQAETDQMRMLATEMRERFRKERAQVRVQLSELEAFVAKTDGSRITTLLGKLKAVELPPRYEYLERAFFADAQGELSVYMTRDSQLPPATNVGKRKYFETLKADPGLEVIEPIHSWATAEPVTVFAKAPADHRYVAAAIVTSRPLFGRSELAGGYLFAVVDNHGDALYHNRRERVGVENLLTECAEAPDLADALRSRTESVFHVIYSGVPHRILIVPLFDPQRDHQRLGPGMADWRLVILHAQGDLRSLRWRLIARFWALFAALLALYLVVGAGFILFGRKILYLLDDGTFIWRRIPRTLLVTLVLIGALSGVLIFTVLFQRETRKLTSQNGGEAREHSEPVERYDWWIAARPSSLFPYAFESQPYRENTYGRGRWFSGILLLLSCSFAVGACFALTLWTERRLLGLDGPADDGAKPGRRVLWLAPKGSWIDGLSKEAPADKRVKKLSMSALSNDLTQVERSVVERDLLLVYDFGWELPWMEDEDRERTLRGILTRWTGYLWLVSESSPQEIRDRKEVSLANLLGELFESRHPKTDDGEAVQGDSEQVWKGLTTDERWVLWKIAKGSRFHPAVWPSAVRLRRYGLVGFDPWPRIREGRFEHFVLEHAGEGEPDPPPTGSLRTVFMVVLIVLAGFLAFTYENLLASLTGALVAIGALAAAVVKLDEYVRQPKAVAQGESPP
jgi:hypothetical protein